MSAVKERKPYESLQRALRRDIEMAIYSGDEEEVTTRLIELVESMVSFQSVASAELAGEIYKAIRLAWRHNREEEGTGSLGRRWERETVRRHTALVEAIRRSKKEVMR